jgi:hypothetical protein
MQALFLYALITPALYYLGSKALITQRLWTWYEERWPRFGAFMQCAACSGTWYGMASGTLGWFAFELPFLGVEHDLSFLLVGLGSCFWTPVLAATHDRALRYLGGEEGS